MALLISSTRQASVSCSSHSVVTNVAVTNAAVANVMAANMTVNGVSNAVASPSNNRYVCSIRDNISAINTVIHILAHSNPQKWTLLVAPEQVPNKAILASKAIGIERLMLVRAKQMRNPSKALQQALTNGNFAAVILWPEQISQPITQALNHIVSNTPLYALTWSTTATHAVCH